MKNIFTVLILVVFGSTVQAQAPSYCWTAQMSGDGSDFGQDVTTDANGNVYVTGYFTDTVDFDPGAGASLMISAGGDDIFVYKSDSAGNFIWAKQFGGPVGYDRGFSIVVDDSGNVFTTGVFNGTADFDPGAGTFSMTSAGSNDMFISKLDSSGNFVWAKRVGDFQADGGNALVLDDSGNVFVTGYFRDTVDFDPGNSVYWMTANGSDGYVLKLDPAGDFIWARQFTGPQSQNIQCMVSDPTGYVYISGSTSDTMDMDPGAGSLIFVPVGLDGMFVSKLDAAGNLVWSRAFSGSMNSTVGPEAIAIDANGNVYTTGGFSDTIDFDPGVAMFFVDGSGSTNMFITKLTPGGNFVWVKNMFATNICVGLGIEIDGDKNIYAAGEFRGTADFDPGTGTYSLTGVGSLRNAFVSKLDSTGSFVWAAGMGGNDHTYCDGLALDLANSVYTTGYFTDTVDFNPWSGFDSLVSAFNSRDIYIHKICQNDLSINIPGVESPAGTNAVYPNPASGVFTLASSTGIGSYVISDVAGKILQKGLLDGPTTTIDISALAGGVYFVQVGNQALKLVVQ